MEITLGKLIAFGVVIVLSAITIASACGTKAGNGWGQEVIVLPKPTLIPKLAAAFHDGKASVAHKGHVHIHKPVVHHGIKAGHGWEGPGKFGNGLDGFGHGDYEFGYAVNSPVTRDVKSAFEKGSGDHVKGHYSMNDGKSYKDVHYETNGGGIGGPEQFADYDKK